METLLVHPQNSKQLDAIKAVLKVLNVPFESQVETVSSKVSREDIDQAYDEMRAGQYTVLDPNNLWK
ncbi:DUF2683 family protein [Olivibacter sitiensis]|uniref:DUF2683 family protein n=1 Tax=Olivibacter sitiensis TaxID=376470 RepID=UPI000404C84C|nr:DUF2683 family protein [Olivibacter sitiensis]